MLEDGQRSHILWNELTYAIAVLSLLFINRISVTTNIYSDLILYEPDGYRDRDIIICSYVVLRPLNIVECACTSVHIGSLQTVSVKIRIYIS
jgi:hypothetical protein